MPFTLNSQCPVIAGNSSGESVQVLAVFLSFTSENGDWPLIRLCEWNWRFCMRTVVVHTRNCQILIGRNIYMVSYPFKIFTSVRLTRRFCNSFWLQILVFLSNEHSFVCAFEIAGPSKSVRTAVAVQDRRIPDRKAANQIARFYRK